MELQGLAENGFKTARVVRYDPAGDEMLSNQDRRS